MKFDKKVVSVAMSVVLAAALCPGVALAKGADAPLKTAGVTSSVRVTDFSADKDLTYAMFHRVYTSSSILWASSSQPLVAGDGVGKDVSVSENKDGSSSTYTLSYVFATGSPFTVMNNTVYVGDEAVPSSGYEWVFYDVDTAVWSAYSSEGYTERDSAPSELGRYAVSARGVGDYTGESSKAQIEIIAPNDLRGADVSIDGVVSSYYVPYTGDPVSLGLNVSLRGTTLTQDTHYTVSYVSDGGSPLEGPPTDTGYYKAIVSAVDGGGYAGSTEVGFQVVNPKDLAYGDLRISGGTYYPTYAWNNGNPVVPSDVAVTDMAGNRLTMGTDYKLVYTLESSWGDYLDTVSDEGTYRVYAKGINDYSGVTDSIGGYNIFCIAKPEHDISKASVSMQKTYSYNDGASMEDAVNPTVVLNGKTLVAGTDYRLFYSKGGWAGSGSLGEHRFWIFGMGDYLGEQQLSYSVVDGEVPVNGDVTKEQPVDDKPAGDMPASAPSSETGASTGTTVSVGGAAYKVTSAAAATVSYQVAPKTKSTATVPATVTVNGKKYAVTGIAKNAFKGAKAKTVTVKSAKLTKKGVKGCFKGSKVKTVKVKVGSKKANKKAIKKYKKYFTKANCGKKVTVK